VRPPTRPLRVDHLGYYTRNARKTVQFWTEVMRCKFTSSIWNPELPSTRQPYPYLHIFFELGDGSTVAFFEIPDVGEEATPAEPLRTVNHMAMHLDSVDDVYAWKEWLESKGIDVVTLYLLFRSHLELPFGVDHAAYAIVGPRRTGGRASLGPMGSLAR